MCIKDQIIIMNVSPKGRKKSDIGKDYNKHWLIQVHGVHCQLYLLPLIKNRFVHTLDIKSTSLSSPVITAALPASKSFILIFNFVCIDV